MRTNADKGGVGSECMRMSTTLLVTNAYRAGVAAVLQQCTVILITQDGSACTKQTARALVPRPLLSVAA